MAILEFEDWSIEVLEFWGLLGGRGSEGRKGVEYLKV